MGRWSERAPEGDAEYQAYFDDQLGSNEQFWSRFGARRPQFAGKRVLDLGCGVGALCFEVARQGGAALGIELDERPIEFAQRLIIPKARDLPGSIEFRIVDLHELGADAQFDVVLCKDTFEHVEDVEHMMTSIFRVLRPGGELWAGFSPLYNSPFGDHGRTGLRVPWAHAVLPKAIVMRAASRRQGDSVRSLTDIGLNGITAPEFKRYARAAGFEITSELYNSGNKRGLRVLNYLRRVPGLGRFATVGLYVVLSKRR